MRQIRIHIVDRAERAKGVPEMSKHGRVVCLRGNEFVVAEQLLSYLDTLNVSYSILSENDTEDALRAVRDLVTSSV